MIGKIKRVNRPDRRRAVASRHNWENRAADMYAAITARRSCSSAAPARDG